MPEVGESRKLGSWLVSVVDDHDNLSCEKVRFSFTAPVEHQIAAALALQFFTLSIPCIYYGSEQYLSYNGPAAGPGYQVNYLEAEGWGSGDWYLREAMFGPEHPLVTGSQGASVDMSSSGYGPFGTSGFHCFDEADPTFIRVAHLLAVRQQKPGLRTGRQYQRPLGLFGWGNLAYPSGEIIAWSRILDDHEFLVIVNGNGIAGKDADILVDFNLNRNGSSMSVIANTAERATVAGGGVYHGPYPVGSLVAVNLPSGGPAFVTINDLDPSEVLILGSVGA